MTHPSTSRRPRRPRTRARIALAALLLALMASGLRIDAGAAAVTLQAVGGGAVFNPAPDAPLFVLVLGSDERPGLDGARSDAIHVIGLNAPDGSATILNIPRDTFVNVPGHGQRRVNEAYHYGGAELAARTVSALVGVPIRLVAVTTFTGLEAMVDDLGGLVVGVPMHMDDRNSGAAFEPGIQRLSGRQVLAFSRNRHVPGGDLTRTTHQGQLILAALSQLRIEGADPLGALRALNVLLRHARVEGVDVTELYRLGLAGLTIDPARVRNVTMPARLGQAGSASVVFPAPGAGGLFADFADDAVLQAH